jgi:hypothetical protein
MKKKNASRKAPIKLDLEKIEIDVLSDSMLNGLQGGYGPSETIIGCGGGTTRTECCQGTWVCTSATLRPCCPF